MGIPVNLDEVDSHRLSSLPALTISTNFGDMRPPPPVRRSLDSKGKGKEREVGNGTSGSGHTSARPGTGGEGKYGLGNRPDLDVKRAEELCGIDEGE